MNDTPAPQSLIDHLKPALALLTSTHPTQRAKQESAIIAIIDRQIAGEAFDTAAFWQRPDTPARSTYSKWRQHDTAFVAALEAARSSIRDWQASAAVSAVEEALTKMQLATPEMVARILQIAATSSNEFAVLQAAFGALDRASKTTAPKQQDVNIPGLDSALDKIYGDDDDQPDDAK